MASKRAKRDEARWRTWLRSFGGRSRTSSNKSQSSSRRRSERTSRPEQFQQLRVRVPNWREFADSLPPWADEVAAILLLVFGIVSLLALLNFTPEATFTSSWAGAIRQLFGLGGIVVAIGIFSLGVIILLPKLGIILHFPWQRILAIEVAFISFLALLHLLANDPEPRALARGGQGGGYIGWALSQLIARLFDPITSTLIYGFIFIIALSRVIGMQQHHVKIGLDWLTVQLHTLAGRLEGRAAHLEKPPALPPPIATTTSIAKTSVVQQAPVDRLRSRPSIVPLPTDREHKPHVRVKESVTKESKPQDRTRVASKYVQPDPDKLQRGLSSPGFLGERPSIVPRGAQPNTASNYQPASPVPRARRSRDRKVKRDAQGRRYFRAAEIKEQRRTGKRANLLPSYDLLGEHELNQPTDEELNGNARIIEDTLNEFGIYVEVIDVKIGPAVTQYAVQPFKEITNEQGELVVERVRVGKISALESDLTLALEAKRLRIEAPVPGFSYVGVEVPNKQPSIVSLLGVIESAVFYRKKAPLTIPLGRDVSGASFVTNLASMPHLLVAGTTGSGKSVALTSMITAFVMNNTPDKLKLILLDPKMVELSRFNGLPHLLGPVETDQERIIGVLRWSTREMDRRYKLLEVEAARNIEVYNRALGRRRKDEHLPYIAIIFDEIGDLMLSRPDETEKMLTRLAQMARAVGIHLIVATQRPSVDVITGLIKANFPARISFAVASGIDSRVILDTVGAETLVGKGDMLFLAADAAGPQRIQGCFVSDEEITRVVDHWKTWREEQVEMGKFELQTVAPWERGMTRREILAETDPMLEEAITLVVEAAEASASLIQRRLGVGYPRAARLMDLMQELGIIGAPRAGGRTREVLYKTDDEPFKKLVEKRTHGRQ